MKEVWIRDPNYHKIRRTSALNSFNNHQCFKKLYQTLEIMFHDEISKHSEVILKNSAAPRFFKPLLNVCIFVFDILHESLNIFIFILPITVREIKEFNKTETL